MEYRTAFPRQPARILLVDLDGDFDSDSLNNLCSSLENLFSLVCSLSGPVRLRFFGLFALGNYPEALFPLQHVKANFGRLQSALAELKSFQKDQASSRRTITRGQGTGSVTQGVLEAINMFKRQAQGLLQTAGYWCQLELTVLTVSNSLTVTRQVEKALKQLNMDSLKKICVVSVCNPERLQTLHEDMMSQGSSHSDASSNSEVTGVVEVSTVDNDVLSLENYFRGWLHDVGTDKEHLHVVMPAPNMDGERLVLKCDLQERLLSPALTPFHTSFTIQAEGPVTKPMSSTGSKTPNNNVPVYVLQVVKKLSTSALCESVLYGMPVLVKATTCWKIDWDELETNHQHFQSLCGLMQEQNECLLVRLDEHQAEVQQVTKGRQKSNFRYNMSTPQPKGHFVLLPSHSNTMLLKSVAVRELMLPCDYHSTQTPDDHVITQVKQALQQVEREDLYNPLLHESGLSSSLTYQLSGPGTAQGKRKAVTAGANQAPPYSRSIQHGQPVNVSGYGLPGNSITLGPGYKQSRQKNQSCVYNTGSGDNPQFQTEL